MSLFSDKFREVGITKLVEYTGDPITYTIPETGVSQTLNAVARELVPREGSGFVDEFRRKLFFIAEDDLTIANPPQRGHKITLNGEEWSIMVVRDNNDAEWEVQAWRGFEVT